MRMPDIDVFSRRASIGAVEPVRQKPLVAAVAPSQKMPLSMSMLGSTSTGEKRGARRGAMGENPEPSRKIAATFKFHQPCNGLYHTEIFLCGKSWNVCACRRKHLVAAIHQLSILPASPQRSPCQENILATVSRGEPSL